MFSTYFNMFQDVSSHFGDLVHVIRDAQDGVKICEVFSCSQCLAAPRPPVPSLTSVWTDHDPTGEDGVTTVHGWGSDSGGATNLEH